MKYHNFLSLLAIAFCFLFVACGDDSATEVEVDFDFTGEYTLSDQMARPAINTVFVAAENKDDFNTTIPAEQGSEYADNFEKRLMALNPGYTTNALGLDAATFTSVLASDVLSVATTGTTTFFDGTNVLTGRALADDVIDTELLLIFGGPDGTANPGLTSDNVSANDKEFLNTFPYLASPW